MIVAQLPYTDNRPFVRFKGKFRDLIPQGWTFKKCFGHNYRCYEKQVTYGQRIEIWVHCGGYVEIDAFGGYSSLFVQFLLDEANAEKVQKAFDAELGERGRLHIHQLKLSHYSTIITCYNDRGNIKHLRSHYLD